MSMKDDLKVKKKVYIALRKLISMKDGLKVKKKNYIALRKLISMKDGLKVKKKKGFLYSISSLICYNNLFLKLCL